MWTGTTPLSSPREDGVDGFGVRKMFRMVFHKLRGNFKGGYFWVTDGEVFVFLIALYYISQV